MTETYFFQRWLAFGLRKTVFYFIVKCLMIFWWDLEFWRDPFTGPSKNRILFCDNWFKKQSKLVFQIKWSLLVFWVPFFTLLNFYFSKFQRNCNSPSTLQCLHTIRAWNKKLCIFECMKTKITLISSWNGSNH